MSEHAHCWHPNDNQYGLPPVGQPFPGRCCWCGVERQVAEYRGPPPGHGPHAPPVRLPPVEVG